MQTELSEVGGTMTGYELDGRLELALFTDSQDLAHLLGEVDRAALARAGVCAGDVTALLLDLETPEGQLWAAETRSPGSLKAFYSIGQNSCPIAKHSGNAESSSKSLQSAQPETSLSVRCSIPTFAEKIGGHQYEGGPRREGCFATQSPCPPNHPAKFALA